MTTLTTFNIRNSLAIGDLTHHWRFRKQAVVNVLQRLDADIMCMQEVRGGQLDYLKERFHLYDVVATPRNDGLTKGEASPVFVGPNFRLDGFETRWFSATPNTPGSKFPEVSQPRIATIARATEVQTEKRVAFVNTHLDSQFRSVREHSVRLLADWARVDDIPWVITGDFNCNIDSPEMEPLLENGWKDALAELAPSGPGVATFNGYKRHTDGPRIDHILVPDGMAVNSARVVNDIGGPVPSDHWPVIADFDL